MTVVTKLTLTGGKKYRGLPLPKGRVPQGSGVIVTAPCSSVPLANTQVTVRGGWSDGSFAQATIWTDLPVDTLVDLLVVPTPSAPALVPSAANIAAYSIQVGATSYPVALSAADFVNPIFSGPLTTRYRIVKQVTPEAKLGIYADVHPAGVFYSAFVSLADRTAQGTGGGYMVKITCTTNGDTVPAHHLDALAESPPLRSKIGLCFQLWKYETSFDYDICSGIFPPIKNVPVSSTFKADLDAEGTAAAPFWGSGMQPAWMASSGERPAIGVLPNSTTLTMLVRDNGQVDGVYEQANKARQWSGQQLRNADFSIGPITEVNNIWPGITAYYGYVQGSPLLAAPIPQDTQITGLYSDNAHLPHDTFIPAMYSGDEYHVESTIFKAFASILNNPYGTALRVDNPYLAFQVRGVAWSLVALAHAYLLAPVGSPEKAKLADWTARIIAKTQSNLTSRGPNPLGLFLDTDYGSNQRIAAWQTTHIIKALLTAHSFGFANAKTVADALLVYYTSSANSNFHGVFTTWNLQVTDASGNAVTTYAATNPQDENYSAIPVSNAPSQANPWDLRSLVKDVLGWGAAFGNTAAAAAWSYYNSFSSSSYNCFYDRTSYCPQWGNKYDSRPDAFTAVSCVIPAGAAPTTPAITGCPANGPAPRTVIGTKNAGDGIKVQHNAVQVLDIPADNLTAWQYVDNSAAGARSIAVNAYNECGSSGVTAACAYTITPASPTTSPTYTGPTSGAIISGTPSSFTLSAAGTAPFAYGLTGAIPAGVSTAGASLVYDGTPISAGSYPFNIVTTSPGTPIVDTDGFTLTVTAAAVAPAYTGPSSINAPGTVTANGTAPITYAFSGVAPGGLVIDSATGNVTGTVPGTYSVIVVATNGAGSLNIPLSITVPVAPTQVYKFASFGDKIVTYGGKIVKILV